MVRNFLVFWEIVFLCDVFMGNLLFFIVGKFSFYEIVFICSSDCWLDQRTSFDYFFIIISSTSSSLLEKPPNNVDTFRNFQLFRIFNSFMKIFMNKSFVSFFCGFHYRPFFIIAKITFRHFLSLLSPPAANDLNIFGEVASSESGLGTIETSFFP